MSDRLDDIKARFADTGAVRQSDATWLVEQVEQARRIAVELENRVEQLTDELAEVNASHDPRLRCLILKAAPDRDLYIGWSNTCDMPAGAWTRTEAIEYGFPPSRLNRADETGTSSKLGDGAWDDPGFVAEQRGWLKRDRLGDYAMAWLSGRQNEAFNLLEPFEGESEVRR
ncbi:hypothetical protein ABZ547_08510 [Streptomyces sparsogenes]|uniref:hypothetical protein n=1 Tax=Streptomyces sparsogenes TaxID=67365 RepID=UPI0033F4C90E